MSVSLSGEDEGLVEEVEHDSDDESRGLVLRPTTYDNESDSIASEEQRLRVRGRRMRAVAMGVVVLGFVVLAVNKAVGGGSRRQQSQHRMTSVASSSSKKSSNRISLRRSLGEEAFEELNQLLGASLVNLPDMPNMERDLPWPLTKMYVDITNFQCSDSSLKDVELSYERVPTPDSTNNATDVHLDLAILGFNVHCALDWAYRYDGGIPLGWVKGHGSSTVTSTGSSISATLQLKAPTNTNNTDSDIPLPPTSSDIDNCRANIIITDVNFQGGGLVGVVLQQFKDHVRRAITDAVTTASCEEVNDFNHIVDQLLDKTGHLLEPYLKPQNHTQPQPQSDPAPLNPLALERTYTQTNHTLLDFASSDIVDTKILPLLRQLLNLHVDDTTSPHDGKTTLAVNALLRSTLLDADGAFVVDLDDILPSFAPDGILYQGKDVLTETTLTLTSLKFFGLDSFQEFDLLELVGSQTLQSRFRLDHLSAEVGLKVHMKPAIPAPNAGEGADQVDNITVRVGVKQITTTMALFLAIANDVLANTQLGSLLYMDQVLPCFLSSVQTINVTQLWPVPLEYLDPPFVVDGFRDVKGAERLVTDALGAAHLTLGNVVLKALPAIFQITVRRHANLVIQGLLEDARKGNGTVCPQPRSLTGHHDEESQEVDQTRFVEFQQMFAGLDPYGNFVSTALDAIQKRFLAQDPDKPTMSLLNSAVIDPLTTRWSMDTDAPGMIPVNYSIFSFASPQGQPFVGLDEVVFAATMARMEHVDTVLNPVKFLQTRNTTDNELDKYTLDNALSIGLPEDREVRAVMNLLVDLQGPHKSFAMRNEVEVSVAFAKMQTFASVLAMLDAQELLTFPLKNVFNLDCWLALIPPPTGDNEFHRNITVGLTDFAVEFDQLDVDVACVNCTSPNGVHELPSVLSALQTLGTMSLLGETFFSGTSKLLQGDLVQSRIDKALRAAEMHCPHGDSGTGTSVLGDVSTMRASEHVRALLTNLDIPVELVEVAVFGSSLVAQSIAVMLAVDHAPSAGNGDDPEEANEKDEEDPLEAERELAEVIAANGNNTHLLDFVALRDEQDLFALGLDFLHNQLGGSDDEGNLGINSVIRSALLQNETSNDGGYTLPGMTSDATVIPLGGENVVRLSSPRVFGLDSFTKFDVLEILGSQTIQSHVSMESLAVEVKVTVEQASSPKPMDRSRTRPVSSESVMLSQRKRLSETESFTIRIGVKDIDATISFLLGIDIDALGDIQLGSILDVLDIFPCFMTAVAAANVTQLSMDVGAIDRPSVSGFSSEEMENALVAATDAIFDRYETLMVRAVPNFFGGVMKDFLNGVLKEEVSPSLLNGDIADADSMDSEQCRHRAGDNSAFVDFRDLLLGASSDSEDKYGNLMRMAKGFIDANLLSEDPATGEARINDAVIRPLTKAQSNETGTLKVEGDVFRMKDQFPPEIPGLEGGFEVGVFNFTLVNLDTVGSPLSVLQPHMDGNGQLLDNSAMMGIVKKPVRASVGVLFGLEANGVRIRNDVVLTLEFAEADVLMSFLAKMNQTKFFDLSLKNASNPFCWLSTIPAPVLSDYGVRVDDSPEARTAALAQMNLSVDKARMALECISCTSPGLRDISTRLESEVSSDEATTTLNDLLASFVSMLEGDFLQTKVDRVLNNAETVCQGNTPHGAYKPFNTPKWIDTTGQFVLAVVMVIACALVLVALFVCGVRVAKRRRHARWLLSMSDEDVCRVRMEQEREEVKERNLNASTTSMFSSDQIPKAIRWGMPIVIFGTIVLFLTGHLSLGAVVVFDVTVAGQSVTIDKFFEFSIMRSISEIWNAGAVALSLLMLGFSVVWPYTKQLITLGLWFAPPSWISVSRRGAIFDWLDTLAKWSMVDIFVLVVTMAAFRVSILSPQAGQQAAFLSDLFAVELMVIPVWGLFANMIAQLISHVSSHYILYYHELIAHGREEDSQEAGNNRDLSPCQLGMELEMEQHYEEVNSGVATADQGNGEETRELTSSALARGGRKTAESRIEFCYALHDHIYEIESGSCGRRHLTVRRGVDTALGILGFVTAALLVAGCVVPSFRLETLGLVGIAVRSGQGSDATVRDFSVFGLAEFLMTQARYLDIPAFYAGLGCLASLIVFTCLIFPLIQTGMLLQLWYTPVMTMKKRKSVYSAIRTVEAWQYVEVYFLSIIIATWQLGDVSGFLINDLVGNALDGMFSSLVFYGFVQPDDAQSFYIKASVLPGMYILLAAGVGLLFLSQFILRAHVQQMHDITQEEMVHDVTTMLSRLENGEEDMVAMRQRIKPRPMRFTDCFPCLLMNTMPTPGVATSALEVVSFAASTLDEDGEDTGSSTAGEDDDGGPESMSGVTNALGTSASEDMDGDGDRTTRKSAIDSSVPSEGQGAQQAEESESRR